MNEILGYTTEVCFIYFDSMVPKPLNGMDDTTVCLTMCLDIIDRCNSRLDMPHTRD